MPGNTTCERWQRVKNLCTISGAFWSRTRNCTHNGTVQNPRMGRGLTLNWNLAHKTPAEPLQLVESIEMIQRSSPLADRVGCRHRCTDVLLCTCDGLGRLGAGNELRQQCRGKAAARAMRSPGLDLLTGEPAFGSVCRQQEVVWRVEMASGNSYVKTRMIGGQLARR